MLPYKPISIPYFDEIQSQLIPIFYETITDYSYTHTQRIPYEVIEQQVPRLIEFITDNNLIWNVGRFFVTAPNDGLYIHVDGNDECSRIFSLNLPLLNCDDTQMNWWDNVEIVELRSDESYGNNIAKMDSENKILTHSLSLTSPHLVRVDIPHSVENPQDKIRAIFSMRFKPEPYHLWY